MTLGRILRVETPRVFAPLLGPARYKGLYGGRGGGKSHHFAEAIVVRSVMRPGLRFAGIREIQRTLSESVKRLVEDKIIYLGVQQYFEVQKSEIKSHGGGLMLFHGMQDHTAESIKSLERMDVSWVEEGQSLSKRSLDLLRPTIRAPGSELWFSWNPSQPTDAVDAFLRSSDPPPDSVVVHCGWQDNPWLPDELRAEIEYDYRIDPNAAAHVWEGEYWARTDAQVLGGKWVVDAFEPKEEWDGPYHGVDWGFSRDPTVLVRLWIFAGTLYVEHEAYGVGVDLGADTSRLFDSVPLARGHILRADNARPESISLMRKGGTGWDGWSIVAAPKWAGSVQDGVGHLRGFERIVIHPRCKYAEREARLYSHKVDRLSGDVMPAIDDKHNHIWDAVRYALAPLIRHRKWSLL